MENIEEDTGIILRTESEVYVSMEDIRIVLRRASEDNFSIEDLSIEEHTIIGWFLSDIDNFIVGNQFNEELYEHLQEIYYGYLDRTEPTHKDDEPPTRPTPLQSFRTDTCVICLMKEPNILFTDCRHICICLECEKIKPLNKCPYCRVNISTKIIV